VQNTYVGVRELSSFNLWVNGYTLLQTSDANGQPTMTRNPNFCAHLQDAIEGLYRFNMDMENKDKDKDKAR
jgi:hypothetical protein